MGVGKWILAGVAAVLSYLYVLRRLTSRLPTVVDGTYHPDFKPVADIFRANVESGAEPGAAIALYHEGKCVLDMWGGYADVVAKWPWDKHTMTIAFSASKGLAAIVVAQMVQKGLLDYKRPVADYWPEFAQKDKGNITVEMLLSHRAGLVLLDTSFDLRDMLENPEEVEKALASQGTVWPAGSQFGYHGVTYGMYVDTLVQKVDPKGRTMDRIFREDIAEPFGVDVYMNTPKELFYRAARLHIKPIWQVMLDALASSRYRYSLGYLILFPDSLMGKMSKAIHQFRGDFNVFNDPNQREVTLSAATATGTARGLARLYGILANKGVDVDSQQTILFEELLRKLATPLSSGKNVVTLTENSMFGPGTMIMKNPKGQLMFGHTGHGGQVALADPANKMGISYLTNHISIYGMADDPRYVPLREAIYKCLESLQQKKKDL